MTHVIVDVMTGEYLEAFDPDYGWASSSITGLAVWTDDLAKAKRFLDAGEAIDLYRRQSTRRPLRPDGRPNRPLTMCTVEFRKVEDE